jgi:hypothetical protein
MATGRYGFHVKFSRYPTEPTHQVIEEPRGKTCEYDENRMVDTAVFVSRRTGLEALPVKPGTVQRFNDDTDADNAVRPMLKT